MFNPVSEAQAIEHRKRDLLRQAKLQQIAAEVQQDQAKLHERFLAMVGDLMITGGSRLKKRYDAANHAWTAPVFYDVKPQNS